MIIPFDKMDETLKAINRDREWLAEQSDYASTYIRDVLAPNSRRRNKRIQKTLSDIIAREREQTMPPLPERISLEPSRDELKAWTRAFKASNDATLYDWMIRELNAAAQQWMTTPTVK